MANEQYNIVPLIDNNGNKVYAETIGDSILDDTITSEKIKNSNITNEKIANNAVTTDKVTDLNITEAKLASNAVTETKIADSAITASKIANGSINGEKISTGAISSDKIATNAVGYSALSTDIQNVLSVNATAELKDNTIVITAVEGATNFIFLAPSDFNSANVYTLNGALITVTDLNNEPLKDAWKQGSPVSFRMVGSHAFFSSGGTARSLTQSPWEVGDLTDGEYSSLTFADSAFMTVSNTGFGQVKSSYDGIHWSSQSTNINYQYLPNSCYSAYGNGIYISVYGSNPTQVNFGYSYNGADWVYPVDYDFHMFHNYENIIFANNKFYLYGRKYDSVTDRYQFTGNSTLCVWISTDGFNWTENAIVGLTSLPNYRTLTYGNGKFIFGIMNSSDIYYSSDGITWKKATNVVAYISDITYSETNKIFIACTYNSSAAQDGSVYTSTDGVNWSVKTAITTPSYSVISLGKRIFLSGTANFTIYYTDDLFTSLNSLSVPYIQHTTSTIWRVIDNVLFLPSSSYYFIYTKDGKNFVSLSTSNLLVYDVIGTLDFTKGYLYVPKYNVNTNPRYFSVPYTDYTNSNEIKNISINIEDKKIVASNGDKYFILNSSRVSPAYLYYGRNSYYWNRNQWVNPYSTSYARSNPIGVNDMVITSSMLVAIGDKGWYYTTTSNFNDLTEQNYVSFQSNITTAGDTNTDWKSICYGNNKYVAIASSGTKRLMVNGALYTLPYNNSWNSICYGNGKFVAVSSDGNYRIMTSLDGINWEYLAAPEDNEWMGVCYGNEMFVAVAKSGIHRVMYSRDAYTWELMDAAEQNSWVRVCYGSGRFVAISNDGEHRVMSWKYPSVANPYSVEAQNKFIGEGSDIQSGNVTSPLGGTSWYKTPYSTSVSQYGLKSVNGIFFNNYQSPTFSVDGMFWSTLIRNGAPQTAYYNQSYAYGNGKYVMIARYYSLTTGTWKILTSKDLNGWTFNDMPVQQTYTDVTFGNGKFVAISSDGDKRIATSTDGVTWTYITAPEQNEWSSICYANNLFVAVATSGTNRVMTSTDAVTWSSQVIIADSQWVQITYGDGVFVAVTANGSKHIAVSTDGMNWIYPTLEYEDNFNCIAYGNGKFVTVGDKYILSSRNGLYWRAEYRLEPSTATSNNKILPYGLAFENSRFILASNLYGIMISGGTDNMPKFIRGYSRLYFDSTKTNGIYMYTGFRPKYIHLWSGSYSYVLVDVPYYSSSGNGSQYYGTLISFTSTSAFSSNFIIHSMFDNSGFYIPNSIAGTKDGDSNTFYYIAVG